MQQIINALLNIQVQAKYTQAQFYNKLVKFYKNHQKCMEYIKNSGKQKSVAFSVKKTLGDF